MASMSISRAISWLATEDPDRLAARDDHRSLTRSQLDSGSNRLARTWAAQGVGLDDLVTIRLPNSVDFVLACVAVWKLGATPQPLSYRLPLDEQRAIVELANSALVVGGSAGQFPGRTLAEATLHPDDSPLPDAAASSWKAPTSSGSTGTPKIVMAAAAAKIDPTASVAAFIPLNAVQLVAGPLYHSAPFTYAMRGLMTGHSLVILPRFDEARVLDAIAEHSVTWMMLVPTMMHRISWLPASVRATARLETLESIVHLGAPCDRMLKREWIDWLGANRVVEVYVGTESSGITMITGSEWLERPGSVGRPVGGSSIRIVDAAGQSVAPGTVGRIELTRRGVVPFRYLGRPAPEPGWSSLGDLGRLDDDGYLWVLDREDDLIITGSVNVYPVEVEAAIERHPLVRSAVAFGVADVELGQRVHAIVDVASSELHADVLGAWLRPRLDPEKLPRHLEIVHEPVRDDAGKVRRGRLAAASTSAVAAATRTTAP